MEDGVHRAVKVAPGSELFGGCQQHGGVAVMAAGVHFSGMGAGVGKGVELLHRQRVHIGPQTHTAAAGPAIAPMDDANDPRGCHATVQRNAPAGQLLRHDIGGTHFLETQLRVGVNVFADGGDGGGVLQDGGVNFHGWARRFSALSRAQGD